MSYKRTLQKSKEVPMTDYKKLYFALFNTITDAVEAPDFEHAKGLSQRRIQNKTDLTGCRF